MLQKFMDYLCKIDHGIVGICFLTVVGMYSRCCDLHYPNSVTFDEVHYGSVTTLYSSQRFHIDKQPPLFRLLLFNLFPNYFSNVSMWENIGKDFPDQFSPQAIRLLPAILGTLLIPTAYGVVLKLGFTVEAALLAAILVTFDNALVIQSRFMVADSLQLILVLLSIFFAVIKSWFCFVLSSIFIGLAMSVHLSSLALWIVIIMLALSKAWEICTDRKVSLAHGFGKGCLYIVSSILVPIFVLLMCTTVHLKSVNLSGPHDILMSSTFQASLDGGLKSNGSIVKYGSVIRLRATGDIPPYGSCYLNSIAQIYPLTHEDGRGSSGQQVVGCSYKASSWNVLHPTNFGSQNMEVRDGDFILLIHSNTNGTLNTHDVAAPVSKYKQEVSCVNLNEMHSPKMQTWKVHVVNTNGNKAWKNLHSKVLFEHVNTGFYLVVTGNTLPEWGLGSLEVATEGLDETGDCATEWNAETIPSSKKTSSYKIIHETFNNVVEYLGMTWLLSLQSGPDHRFASEPYEWPFGQSSIAYWYNSTTNAQLHFTGNIASWCGGILISSLLIINCILFALYQRRNHAIANDRLHLWQKSVYALMILGSAYVFQMAYYIIVVPSPKFAYQYLPSVVCLHMLQACALEVFYCHCERLALIVIFIYVASVIWCYWILRSITFGFATKCQEELEHLQLWQSWDLPLT
ncbi:unnamed protein product [Clavelina lepadiformis]|uniref:dolichyl-phosphate-mannose--protein mannosyltransferase n=1 Tax=Clavelina lepadiformis TaxID=159417 RepID=A0ABP0GYU9_CLALP